MTDKILKIAQISTIIITSLCAFLSLLLLPGITALALFGYFSIVFTFIILITFFFTDTKLD